MNINESKEQYAALIQKYLNNELNHEEYKSLWQLMNVQPDESSLDDSLKKLWKDVQAEPAFINDAEWNEKFLQSKQIFNSNTELEKKPKGIVAKMKIYRLAAAVIFLIAFSSVLFLYFKNKNNTSIVKNESIILPQQDRAPGGDRAVLTLADGSTIILDSAGNGVLASQGNTKVIKKHDGQLLYATTETATTEIAYNLLATPRGGQYKITLPDGSKVWLNAASSLKYPVAFVGKERRVEITGEAYFEIAKDASKPFKVQLNKMEVEVLGTHFNVKAYSDEEVIKTTLLEGKVKINTPTTNKQLVPGQQAQLKTSGDLKVVNDVDLEETVAWKDGNFQFDNSDIHDVMRQLARWYDVEISFKGSVSKHFLGGISRNVKLSQVLLMLQQTGEVKFVIEGKKIIVYP